MKILITEQQLSNIIEQTGESKSSMQKYEEKVKRYFNIAREYKKPSKLRTGNKFVYTWLLKRNLLLKAFNENENPPISKEEKKKEYIDKRIQQAQKYKTPQKLREKNINLYNWLSKHGLLQDVFDPEEIKNKEIEKKLELAKDYPTPSSMSKNNPGLYSWLRRNNLLNVVWDKQKMRQEKIEKHIENARENYKDRGDLKRRNKALYNLLYFYDVMDETFPVSTYKTYTDDEIIDLIKDYKYRGDLATQNPSLYALALRRGILDQVMNEPKLKYSDQELIDIGSKYGTRSELSRNNNNVYALLVRRKLIDIAIPHTSEYFLDNLSDEEILFRASKFNSPQETKQKNSSLYNQLVKRNLL